MASVRSPLFAYPRGDLHYDMLAGLTLAAIAIPEQMATARLAGFPAHYGFFAFMAGSLAFAAFGASRFLSSGADSTIAPIFAGSLTLLAASGASEYHELAAALALLVGLLLALGGIFRAGWIADLLSTPVMTGFLAGVSIHIAVSQAPALLGFGEVAGNLFERLATIIREWRSTNVWTLSIGLACLGVIIVGEKISARIPGALIALAAATWAVRQFALEAKGVSVLGPIHVAPPRPSIPEIAPGDLPQLVGLAIIIALIVMVQTAAVSRSFPSEAGAAPNVNRDFLGVGVGSILAGLFGAFAVDASPPRTAIIVETGGRSQISGVVACGVIVAVMMFGSDALTLIPNAALAGVLLFIAARIFRVNVMLDILKQTRAEFGLVIVTMLAVAFLPLQTGVALAIMLSLVHGMWTVTRTRLIEFERLPGATVWWPASPAFQGEKLEGVLVAAFQAPLSFLNAYQFQHDLMKEIERTVQPLKLVVLEASSIVEIDFTAAEILREAIIGCRARGVDFAIARLESIRAQAALERFGVMAALGPGRLFRSVDEATRALAT